MKNHNLSRLLLTIVTLAVCAGCCFSCSSSSGLSACRSGDNFIYSEKEPFGMTRDQALELYADSFSEIADDSGQAWRTSVPTELIPPDVKEMYGRSWRRQLSFDEDAFYMGCYIAHLEPDTFQDDFAPILKDVYAVFGEGSLPEEEYQSLLDQAIEAETDGNATQVCGYWSGSDGSCVQLYVLVGLKSSYEVGIAISGPSDRVKPFSGSKDLTPVLEKLPLENTP